MITESNNIISQKTALMQEALAGFSGPAIISFSLNLNHLELPKGKSQEEENRKSYETIALQLSDAQNKPCIYLFEILTGNPEQIMENFNKSSLKNKSGIKKQVDFETRCLYIGKSESNITHRIKVHLGYRDTTEKGLQLLHWAKELEVSFQLHVIVFNPGMEELLYAYEKKLAQMHKPLIGHK